MEKTTFPSCNVKPREGVTAFQIASLRPKSSNGPHFFFKKILLLSLAIHKLRACLVPVFEKTKNNILVLILLNMIKYLIVYFF